MQIDKLKEEYEGMLQELYNLQQEYDVLNKEYKEQNSKLFDINDKIDDLREEEYKITRNVENEEKKYVDKERVKLVRKTVISLFAIVVLLSFILGMTAVPTYMISMIIATSVLASGPLIYLVAFTSKTERKIKNKYRQTESCIKNADLIEQKLKEINELKSERELLGDPYELYKRVSNLEKQIEAKQKEIDDFKKTVFNLFFVDTKTENETFENEKTAPLVKVRRMDN